MNVLEEEKVLKKAIQHNWHPCSQMKDYEACPPLFIEKARGSYFILKDGQKVLDAISSWWCKSLGHNHPVLKNALQEQLEKFEHVIFAQTTNDTLIEFGAACAKILPDLNKVFYASDGSSAVEIALKMSLHVRKLKGEQTKTKFIALQNAYHGETIGAMSVSDLGLYREPYADLLFESTYIQNIPYVNTVDDPLWTDCSSIWPLIEKQLEKLSGQTTAIIVEPIVQGAGGMKMYSADFLKRLARFAQENNIHFIADEIMTGIGRTGKMLACEHSEIVPDFVCLSKGLSSGWLPLSVVLCKESLYDIFYQDERAKAFLHSHTYSGNALAASVALATLKIIHQAEFLSEINRKGALLRASMQEIADKTGLLENVRQLGLIIASDFVADAKIFKTKIFQAGIKHQIFLRPLGNTLYWLPPLNIQETDMQILKDASFKTLLEL